MMTSEEIVAEVEKVKQKLTLVSTEFSERENYKEATAGLIKCTTALAALLGELAKNVY